MGKLAEAEKIFVVRSLAAYVPPTEVTTALRERFGKSLTPAGAMCYDPTKKQGAELSPRLREEFTRARRRFHKQLDDLPISHLAYRLGLLQDVLDSRHRSPMAVMKILATARAECEMTAGALNPTHASRSPQSRRGRT